MPNIMQLLLLVIIGLFYGTNEAAMIQSTQSATLIHKLPATELDTSEEAITPETITPQESLILPRPSRKTFKETLDPYLKQFNTRQSLPIIDITDFMKKYKGTVSAEALQELLKTHITTMRIPLTITKLAEATGAFNEGIFIAKRTDTGTPVFIIKIINASRGNSAGVENMSEVEMLAKLQASPLGRLPFQQEVATLRDKESLPKLALLEKAFSYQVTDAHNRIINYGIEVLHAARGEMLFNIITSQDPNKYVNWDLAELSHELGKSLGLFHQLFMIYENPQDAATWKTICHGDFHQKNIFVHRLMNEKTKKPFYRITLIDNTNMYVTKDNRSSFDLDIAYFVFNYLLGWKMLFQKDESLWQKTYLMIDNFLKGYVHAFSPQKQPLVARYLKNKLNKQITMTEDRLLPDKKIDPRNFFEKGPDIMNLFYYRGEYFVMGTMDLSPEWKNLGGNRIIKLRELSFMRPVVLFSGNKDSCIYKKTTLPAPVPQPMPAAVKPAIFTPSTKKPIIPIKKVISRPQTDSDSDDEF